MIGPQHVCVLYVATAGLQGSLMGSDEQDIVLLIYVIVDVTQNKVVGVQQYVLRPTTADDPSALNILSEQLTTASALTEELVRAQGRCLEDAMQEFETYCRSLHLDPHGAGFRLVTDGQPPLRQCLHPEACRKGLQLPRYYSQFVDLRKEVKAYVDGKEEQDLQIGGIADMLECLALKVEAENEFYKKEAKDMVNIVQKLIAEGHRFECVENISIVLEPGICSKNDVVDSNCVVRVRGLPWQSSDQDIANFFRGLNVSKGGVALCLSAQGRRNGEALVRFENSEHREMALKRHKHHIGTRYLEIYRASGDDFLEVAGGASTEAQAFLSRGATVIVRMRGLPYDCTAKQVLDFFMAGENSCSVLDGTEGVLFVKKPDGRATGDAFVLFSSETDAPKALSKHRECIGSRYIELFRSTTAEVQQVLNRSMKTHEPPAPLLPTIPQISYLPQHIITSGTRKDCIRLRGLPYEAHVEHILDFLGDYSKNIVFQGVHMVYNAQGQPSGEAFIQMDSEQSAFMTAQQKHNNFMLYGKKQRYIEVFQCSGEDMNMVLTGGLPPAPPNSKVSTPALLSPGMLPSPAVVSPYPPPPATTNMPPPPPPPTSVAQLSSQAPPPYWPPADLAAAQQQAQLIAQQNLLARQTQNQQAAAAHNEHMLLMNQIAQHNYTFINQSIAGGDLGAAAMLKPPHALQFVPASAGMHPYVMLPPRMSPFAFHKPPPMAAYAGPMTPMVPGPMSAMKRSYSDAFSEPTNPAKRPYTGPVPLYQPFYPNMQ